MYWTPTAVHSKLGVVHYNFNGSSVKHGLTLRIGDIVHMLEESKDWFHGCTMSNKEARGIFPKRIVILKKCTVENTGLYEVVTPVTEAIVREVTTVLREWGIIWKNLYLNRNLQMFMALKSIMMELMDYRQHIISKNITEEQQLELKNKIVQKIDWGNSKLGLDLVPRIDGEVVNVDNLSVYHLYKVHLAGHEKNSTVSSTGTLRRANPASKESRHHLFLAVRSFLCNVGDESVASFALYDSKAGDYISEKFLIRYTKYGMPYKSEKMGGAFAIFTDLSSSDLRKDVYIVCQIIREGRLLLDSKKNPSSPVRRPFGCGAIFVGDVLRDKTGLEDEEEEMSITILCPSNEDDFHSLQDAVIRKQTAKYNASGSNPATIIIGVRMFHGELEKVTKENPLVFKADVAESKKIGFPDIILPGDFRNDLHLTIIKAELEKGNKTSQRNVELTMHVVSSQGNSVPDSIVLGSGEDHVSVYRSYVIYHNNSPIWNEGLKLQIPLELVSSCHLRFTYAHSSRHEGKTKSDKIFGFSFLKLISDDGTVVADGQHSLFIYKVDNSVDFKDVKSYLSLPMSADELEEQKTSGVVYAGPPRNSKESLSLQTKLFSTKFSQKHELVRLLKWRMKPDSVANVLQDILTVEADEIVKFLQDIFDALFSILSEKGDFLAMDVFNVLVFILSILEQKKYAKFQSTLETYIEEHFSGALVYRHLVTCLKLKLKNPSQSGNDLTLENAMKSFPFLYKFIIKSKELHSRTTGNMDEEELQKLLEELFATLCDVLASKASHLINVKEAALEKLPDIMDDSLNFFTYEEFSVILCNIINCVPKKASHLQSAKLLCIGRMVAGNLFKNEGARAILFPMMVEHLVFHLERRQEHAICLEILGDLISSIKPGSRDRVAESEVEQLANSLLSILLNVFLTIDRRGPLTGATVACMVGILKLMNETHFDRFLKRFNDKGDLKDFLTKILVAFKELTSQDFFPKDWYVLRILCNNLVLTAVQHLSNAFTDQFLKGDDFDQQLWHNFFQLTIRFITQPSLQLETFLANKRAAVLDRYGDMRQIMGFEVVAMWENLDDKKIHFIPSMIGLFLEITLIPEAELRKATIPTFYDMMKVEFSDHGNFKQVERELIDKLDVLVSQGKGDEDYEQRFKELMSEQVSSCFDPALRESGMVCVDAVCQLLRRLLDYRNVMASYDCGMDQMMMCTVRLLKFYKRISREDMYLRYVYKLCDLHLRVGNFTEAGCTLLLHADLLEWNDKQLPRFMKFPAQTERERKEQLYIEIMEYFNKGKTWENGIRLCKELSQQYESTMFDYSKLSKMLRLQAQYYDNIMTELRPEPGYYRVAFYGKGFPYYLKDHEYIYRGLEYEKLANFTQRLRLQFPNAQVMTKNTPPDQAVVASPGQFIQVCSVQPIATGLTMFEKKAINEKVKGFYKVNDVYTFTYSRPFRRGSKDESEFSTLWLEKSTCQTREQFPGILRWSKIESTDKVELNPLQNAIESIASKNRELAEIIFKFEAQPDENISPLSMILNGVIDANVNGGIANYQKVFLVDDYRTQHPDEVENVDLLQDLLREQVYVLSQGLELHERLATPSIKGLHEKMTLMFESLRESVETGRPVEEFLSSLPQLNSLMDGKSTLTLEGSPKPRRIGISTHETPKSHASMPQIPRGFTFATLTRRVNSAISSSSPTLNRQSSPSVSEGVPATQSSSASSSPVITKRSPESRTPSSDSGQGPPLPPRQSFSSASDSKRASTQSLTVPSSQETEVGPMSGSMPSLTKISEDTEDPPPALPVKQQMDKRRSASSLGLEELRLSSRGAAGNRQESEVFGDRRKSVDSMLDPVKPRRPPSLPARRSESSLVSNTQEQGGPSSPQSSTQGNGFLPSDVSRDCSSQVDNWNSLGMRVPPQSTSPLGDDDDLPGKRKPPPQSTTPLGSLSPRSDASSQPSPPSSPGRIDKLVDVTTLQSELGTSVTSTLSHHLETSVVSDRSRTPSPSHPSDGEGKSKVAEQRLLFEGSKAAPSSRNPQPAPRGRDTAKSVHQGKSRPSSLPVHAEDAVQWPTQVGTKLSRSELDVSTKRPPRPRPRTLVVKANTNQPMSSYEGQVAHKSNFSALPRGKPPPVPPKKPHRQSRASVE